MRISIEKLEALCRHAARQAGADASTAALLAQATARAESQGKTSVGLTHFFDYLHGLGNGAINDKAEPSVSTAGAITRADAHRNIPHRAFPQAVGRLSFAVPLKVRPLVIDQSITPSAFVSIREAAQNNSPLPHGWALNIEGLPTTDALEALEGALLPAGHKLANVGLTVESLAGLAGGLWSLESPAFDKGGESPSICVSIIAINPAFFGENYLERIDSHVQVLEREHGVYIPGRQREIKNDIEVDEQLHEQLLASIQAADLVPVQGVIGGN